MIHISNLLPKNTRRDKPVTTVCLDLARKKAFRDFQSHRHYYGIRQSLALSGINGVALIKILLSCSLVDPVDTTTKQCTVKIFTWTQALALFCETWGCNRAAMSACGMTAYELRVLSSFLFQTQHQDSDLSNLHYSNYDQAKWLATKLLSLTVCSLPPKWI